MTPIQSKSFTHAAAFLDERREKYSSSYKLLEELSERSTDDLQKGIADDLVSKIIDTCRDTKDFEGLRQLSFILFSGTRHLNYDDHFEILAYLFTDEEIDIQVISQVVSIAFKHWKETFEQKSNVCLESQTKKIENFWNGYERNLDRNALVSFLHGGGLFHITDFLHQKENASYRCDRFGVGIYVTPMQQKIDDVSDSNLQLLAASCPRAEGYANKAPLMHCDRPAILFGAIKAKYLSRSGNIYEAVIPKSRAHKIKCLATVLLNIKTTDMPLIIPEQAVESLSDDIELKEKVLASLKRTIDQARSEARAKFSFFH